MGKEDAIEVVVAADPEKGEAAPAPAAPVVAQKTGCAPCICSANDDAIPDASHVLALRILGAITFCFAVIEFGLGGGLFNFFDNAKMGAWWVGLIAALASICAMISVNKAWVMSTCVISAASCVVAIVGAAYDGVYSHKFRGITSCTSSSTGAIEDSFFWGNPDRYEDAYLCLIDIATTSEFVPEGCYCASTKGSDCYEFTLSSYAKYYKQNCGSVITTYSYVMAASCAFCVFVFCFVLTLTILSGVILACPSSLPAAKKTDGKDHIPEEIVVKEEAPADASVVPTPEVESKVGVSVIA